MIFLRTIIHGLLHVPYLFHRITGTGPFGPGSATFLSSPPAVEGQPLKAALFKHHVKQYHEASCSVASMATILNALGDLQGRLAAPVTQMDLLERVATGHWKERMSPAGHNGRRGVPLPLLGEIVESSLNAYGIAYSIVETLQGTKSGAPAALREQLWRSLSDFEERGDCLILAHFDQGAFLRVPNIPHISPVGAFAIASGEVTLLDVDPDQERPYQVSFDTFCRGLFRGYHPVLRPFGYRSGGYVRVGLHPYYRP
jgi:hypothetical protein